MVGRADLRETTQAVGPRSHAGMANETRQLLLRRAR